MALFKCQACGAPLEVKDITDIAFCPYCGMKQTLPKDQVQSANVESLLKRAFMFLEDGDFERANEYCDKVLDVEPENARAYLAKCMADLEVRTKEQLASSGVHISENKNYSKAVRFSHGKLKADLQTISARNDEAISNHKEHIREESIRRKKFYDSGIQLMNEGKYHEAEKMFGELPEDYSDTLSRYKECRYNRALMFMKNGQYDKALEIFNDDFGKTPVSPERFRNYLQREYHGKPAEIERLFRSHLRRIKSEGTHRKDLKNFRDTPEMIKECERALNPSVSQSQAQKKTHLGCMTVIVAVIFVAAILVMYL